MRALVTGGAGFIGSHLCERLLKDGWKVVCLDNLQTGKKENIENFMGRRNFRFILGDVRDSEILDDALKGVDIVFNQMASKKTICEKDPVEDCSINAGGTLNLLLAMNRAGIKKIVHASTGSVYGENDGRTSEFTPLCPVSYYGVSKMAGEKYVVAFAEMFGFKYTILRYFHVYGGRQDSSAYGGVIPIFINKILNGEALTIHGDGEQVRSFTYVDDVIEANIIGALKIDCGIYNCASGIQVSINDLVGRLEDILYPTGINYASAVLGDVKHFDVDNTLIKFDFDLKFTTFDEGLRKTVDWYVAV